jgi:hypothetical protein
MSAPGTPTTVNVPPIMKDQTSSQQANETQSYTYTTSQDRPAKQQQVQETVSSTGIQAEANVNNNNSQARTPTTSADVVAQTELKARRNVRQAAGYIRKTATELRSRAQELAHGANVYAGQLVQTTLERLQRAVQAAKQALGIPEDAALRDEARRSVQRVQQIAGDKLIAAKSVALQAPKYAASRVKEMYEHGAKIAEEKDRALKEQQAQQGAAGAGGSFGEGQAGEAEGPGKTVVAVAVPVQGGGSTTTVKTVTMGQ